MPARHFFSSRSALLRWMGAIVAAVLLTSATAAPAGADVGFINAKRVEAGLPALSAHSGLARVAQRHSAEMANAGRLFHSANLGGSVSSVLAWQGVGENVGVGTSVSDVNAMFMRSAAHRANILGNFNLAGVGVATGADGRVWVTQVFARAATTAGTPAAPKESTSPAPSRVAPTSTAPPRTSAPRVSRRATPPVDRVVETAPPSPPSAVGGLRSLQGGYRVVAEDGGVFAFGEAVFAGSAAELDLARGIVGGASSPSGNGYILFDRRGGVFTFGDADFAGSAADLSLHAPVVAGAMSPTGDGYWLFSADGGVLTFGDARFAGSLLGRGIDGPIVGGAPTPTGQGYWMVGADGQVHAFGDATSHGGTEDVELGAPIRSITATPSGAGYWLLASDGGVFAFGDAGFFGSAGDRAKRARFAALIPGRKGAGYWLVGADGEALSFGSAEDPSQPFYGTASVRIV